jgi:hypothetical protein
MAHHNAKATQFFPCNRAQIVVGAHRVPRASISELYRFSRLPLRAINVLLNATNKAISLCLRHFEMDAGGTTSDSGDELAGSVDISLEYDDYPLDLISPVATEGHLPSNQRDFVISDGYDLYTSELYFNEKKALVDETQPEQDSPAHKVWESIEVTTSNGHVTFPLHDDEKTSLDGDGCCPQRRLFLTKYHPMPEKDTIRDRLIYSLRLPPHGQCARLLTTVMTLLVLWTLSWIFAKEDAFPRGAVFSIMFIVFAGRLVGALLECLRIPGFIGKHSQIP